ncbi:hypothetical protein F4823DRAFT_563596 [Ustulina deusta]|nr:hypothetical protein F4823DRAFT_563596 [Ustulina deusta]
MAYAASPRVYLQRFPAQDARDRTNKFGVSFNNATSYSIDCLRQLLASRFSPISNKPDSFQIWNQTLGSGNSITFIMVDMDQVEANDLIEASSELLRVIRSENGLVLRQNNRDHWMAIALPCGCDQEHSPFPSLQQIPGSPEYRPIPGQWHDPNRCNGQQPPPVAFPAGNANAAGAFGYTPVAVFSGGVPTPGFPTIASSGPFDSVAAAASTAYSRGDAAVASPTGKVVYPPRFEYPASTGAGHEPVVPPASYTALYRESFADAVNPDPAYLVSAADLAPPTTNATSLPAGSPFGTPYNMVPDADLDLHPDQLPTDTSAATAYAPDGDYSYPLIKWRAEDDQTEFQGGGM